MARHSQVDDRSRPRSAILVAPNITPDGATGIGNWSDAQFDAGVRGGRMPDGSRVYPAMPYAYYTKMSRTDVLAIRTYLNTVPPLHNEVVSNQLSFPYRIRSLMAAWNALYFKEGEYRGNPLRSPTWNRGASLVEGPGHCGACHTPKTPLGGDDLKHVYQGYTLQGWFAPDIANNEDTGLGPWSPADIVAYLKRGHSKYSAASGPMGEEVMDSRSQWTEDDLQAIAEYLKGLPAQRDSRRPLPAKDPLMTAGPPSIGTPAPLAETVASSEERTAPQMPAFGWQLTDAQVAAVTTYIRNSWRRAAPAVTERECALHARRSPSSTR